MVVDNNINWTVEFLGWEKQQFLDFACETSFGNSMASKSPIKHTVYDKFNSKVQIHGERMEEFQKYFS